MKKLTASVLALALSLSLAACGGKDKPEESSKATESSIAESSAAESEEKTAAPETTEESEKETEKATEAVQEATETAQKTEQETSENEPTEEEITDYGELTRASDNIVKIMYKKENGKMTLRILDHLKGTVPAEELEDFAESMTMNRAYLLFTKEEDGKQVFTGSEEMSFVLLEGDQSEMFSAVNKELHGNH